MVFDSIANANASAFNANDFSKKKRGNRTAKLKKCKRDARREQWLSQVKNKECKDEKNGGGKPPAPLVQALNKKDPSMVKLVINSGVEENEGLLNHYSDTDSPSNSPTSRGSSVSGSNSSGTNFTGSSRSSCSIGSSMDFYSGSRSEDEEEEEEEEDDGCLDDWEAVADALAADDAASKDQDPNSENLEDENAARSESFTASEPDHVATVGRGQENCQAKSDCRAWRPDDAFRPQSLPNLLKLHSFPMTADRHYGPGGAAWLCNNILSAPSSCPICCEDLDFTDSSFLPCACGFRLCLFCHKRILEDDGRCPGCRKQYDQPVAADVSYDGNSVALRLGRSCSMISRS